MSFLIIERWVEELSARLGRPTEEIQQHGFVEGDFPSEGLELWFSDGSYATLRNAFFVFNVERRRVAVFTKYAGYFEVPMTHVTISVIERTFWTGTKVLGSHIEDQGNHT